MGRRPGRIQRRTTLPSCPLYVSRGASWHPAGRGHRRCQRRCPGPSIITVDTLAPKPCAWTPSPLMTWIDDELQSLHLGDQRLDRRGRLLLARFFSNPHASINAAAQGWAETHAAYQFFDNDKVQPQRILQPHQQATRRRIGQHPVVLLVQDTTELDYTAHPPTGAGPLDAEDRLGFLDHSHIA